jgi:hypothetical protein
MKKKFIVMLGIIGSLRILTAIPKDTIGQTARAYAEEIDHDVLFNSSLEKTTGYIAGKIADVAGTPIDKERADEANKTILYTDASEKQYAIANTPENHARLKDQGYTVLNNPENSGTEGAVKAFLNQGYNSILLGIPHALEEYKGTSAERERIRQLQEAHPSANVLGFVVGMSCLLFIFISIFKSKFTTIRNGMIVDKIGDKHWYKNDLLHREDGPAAIDSNGAEYWFFEGKRHRIDGPAVTCPDGYKAWWIEGKKHRADGPAIIYPNGDERWCLNGNCLTHKKWLAALGKKR